MRINLQKTFIFKLILLLILASFSSHAQAVEKALRAKDFYGYWEIKEAAGDTCYVLVKRNKTATCFWSGQGYNELEIGNWVFQDNKLIIEWENGYHYVFLKRSKQEIERVVYAPQSSIENDTPESRALGNKFKRNAVGSLAVKDTKKEEKDKAENQVDPVSHTSEDTTVIKKVSPMLNPFLGFWEVAASGSLWGLMNEDRFFIHLDRGGYVEMALKEWDEKQVGQKGKWSLQDDMVLIEWPSGHKAIIQYTQDNNIQLSTLNHNDEFSDSPKKNYIMRRAKEGASRLLFSAGNTALLSIEDIIGCWIARNEDDIKSYLEIERWGIARRINGDKVINGNWSINGFDVEIKWEDAQRSVISVSGQRNFTLVHHYKTEEGENKTRKITIIRFKTEKQMIQAYEELLKNQNSLR